MWIMFCICSLSPCPRFSLFFYMLLHIDCDLQIFRIYADARVIVSRTHTHPLPTNLSPIIHSLGCVLLVVYGAQMLWETMSKYRSFIILMGILIITVGTCKTITRNRDWYSRECLLRAGLTVLPHNAKMHYNFGNFLKDSKQHDTAKLHYQEALRYHFHWLLYYIYTLGACTIPHPSYIKQLYKASHLIFESFF